MNKSNLKAYAPQARRDFIAAVTARANLLGVSANAIAPSDLNGDIAIIEGREWPAKVAWQREKLIARIKKDGFEQTVENIAYTWFNRFAALRFMELHDYFDHGWRVLSNREGGLPEILNHASDVTLSGLNAMKARAMQLAGNQDNELYKMLLVAQCNELSRVMPFLFEHIDDETELLLPENLLRTDSIVAKLVAAVPDEDWAQVEAIGWLYQFYISEKKDQVIGKVVKSADIPAATQLFTPNWIVQYLVQNSVGRLWLMANPTSMLKSQWPYYIAPAEQTLEAQAQLDDLIQTRMTEDGGSLNPESITVLDPACGSGHILVEAYELLKAIYLERGYRLRDIPRLILEKNLFGIDIDDRAAQLSGFALIMKARADDRRLFSDPPKLNVLAMHESKGLSLDEIATNLTTFDVQRASLKQLLDIFSQAKTLGTLIQIPSAFGTKISGMRKAIQEALLSGDLYAKAAAEDLMPLLEQARVLAMQFDAVVANPPYMGGKGMNAEVKEFAKECFPDSKSDLFAMFIERGFGWCKASGFNSMVTMQSWMFLSSYESMREKLLSRNTLSNMVHMGNGVMGIAFGTAATIFWKKHVDGYEGSFSHCKNDDVNEDGVPKQFPVQNERLKTAKPDDFKKIAGSPIAYWTSENVITAFQNNKPLSAYADLRVGMHTGENARFIRAWHEVDKDLIELNCVSEEDTENFQAKWYPYNKGGDFRKWYGNKEFVVNWKDRGRDIHNFHGIPLTHNGAPVRAKKLQFKESITWSFVSSSFFGVRYSESGAMFDVGGSSLFPHSGTSIYFTTGFLCSVVASNFLKILNPTLNFQVGNVSVLPIVDNAELSGCVAILAKECIDLSKKDWDSFENSYGFTNFPLTECVSPNLTVAWSKWKGLCDDRIVRMRRLEEENNKLLISAYCLNNELNPDVPEEQVTLARANREKDCQRLISYAIGCMMGRYSLDEPGLIYAHASNVGFDATRYETFPADADGIIPLTDELWFEDDAASRIRDFLIANWGDETLDENIAWLAESLGSKGNEMPDESIRRYVSAGFYKNHLQTYKKRPIYWLFSSGKQGAFQALVYLHRYHEGTLSRMRAEYVVPLTAKFATRIDMLTQDAEQSGSVAARSKILKQIESLRKKQVELLAYDEKLRHHADMRIKLDLDDGVKANYAKFGDLLAEVRAVTGGKDDE